MKKGCLILCLVLLVSVLAIPAGAAETDRTYRFELTADGKQTVEAEYGDVITVALRLYRTDTAQAYDMYAMQSELRYDSSFLELIPGTGTAYKGVNTNDIGLVDGNREYYMNFVSFSGGTKWEPEVLVGTVQFRVIGKGGTSKITNEDFLVSYKDGSGKYPCQSNELLIILSTECTVTFRTNGGNEIPEQTVLFGEKIQKPADPVREGYTFAGWYRDIHLQEPWDFEKDAVEGNMSLYAKWQKGDAQPTEPTEPSQATEPTAPTVPGQPAQPGSDGKGKCLYWWLLLLLILLLLALMYYRYRKYKKEQQER